MIATLPQPENVPERIDTNKYCVYCNSYLGDDKCSYDGSFYERPCIVKLTETETGVNGWQWCKRHRDHAQRYHKEML